MDGLVGIERDFYIAGFGRLGCAFGGKDGGRGSFGRALGRTDGGEDTGGHCVDCVKVENDRE